MALMTRKTVVNDFSHGTREQKTEKLAQKHVWTFSIDSISIEGFYIICCLGVIFEVI